MFICVYKYVCIFIYKMNTPINKLPKPIIKPISKPLNKPLNKAKTNIKNKQQPQATSGSNLEQKKRVKKVKHIDQLYDEKFFTNYQN